MGSAVDTRSIQLNIFLISPWHMSCNIITKTHLYNFDPLKPHFYIVKLGFTGVYIIFLISAQKHRLWVLAEAVLTSTHNLCFERNMKNIRFFIWKFSLFGGKISVYLNRHVFVMWENIPSDMCTQWKKLSLHICTVWSNSSLSVLSFCTVWSNSSLSVLSFFASLAIQNVQTDCPKAGCTCLEVCYLIL